MDEEEEIGYNMDPLHQEEILRSAGTFLKDIRKRQEKSSFFKRMIRL